SAGFRAVPAVLIAPAGSAPSVPEPARTLPLPSRLNTVTLLLLKLARYSRVPAGFIVMSRGPLAPAGSATLVPEPATMFSLPSRVDTGRLLLNKFGTYTPVPA